MDFSEALRACKAGKKIHRTGWNGKEQYILLVSNMSYMLPDGSVVNAGNECIGNKALLFRGTLGDQVGWLASQGDMLAEDWEVMEG